ncbi:flavin reductase family protein [Thalassobius sp. Cn5-15]|uniref:flavin reductase family protein n=1 Tax=Thalassobius sp. Cn5-15 TaxID=2917763 RepID=UPI001EF37965|nr:flavin reductase family protein [Thalassobius sp. Cn5-15]MCG7493084.1 flavin reductase family protein [Thalassobius sp. Cn5-15]
MDTALPHEFVPDAENTRALRDAFGRFATGVTIVTAPSAAGKVAITANSFSSVSLDPPMVLWALAENSNRYDDFKDAQHYAIHILRADQQELAWTVVRDGAALNGLDLTTNDHGVPLLPGCLARFECRQAARYPGGDHQIILGEVLRAEIGATGDALSFYGGKMSSLPCQS